MRRMWVRALAGTLTVGLAGCALGARDMGYAGKNPGVVSCGGKAVITIQGSLAVGSGITGGGTDNGTISFDCGNGAWIKQGLPTADTAVQASAPVGAKP
jgi:hypothetical protein